MARMGREDVAMSEYHCDKCGRPHKGRVLIVDSDSICYRCVTEELSSLRREVRKLRRTLEGRREQAATPRMP